MYSVGAYFPSVSPGPAEFEHVAVGVVAASEADAIRHVQAAVAGHGDFSDFYAEPINPDVRGDWSPFER